MTPLSLRPWSGPALLAVLSAGQAGAVEPPVDLDRPVLAVSGRIAQPLSFSLHQLAALPVRRITTSTQWHPGRQQWEGVSFKTVLGKVGATGTILRVSALNDYAIDIAMADVIKYDPILAYKVDGHYMPVRDKGPLVVIYPYDEQPALNVQFYHNQAVWQVSRITIR
jgi:hypothetical protein